MRFALWNNKESGTVCSSTFYPEYEQDEEINWSISNYCNSLRYNVHNRKLVSATYIGGVLEIYDVGHDGIKTSAIKYFYDYNDYKLAEGAVPKWVTVTDRTRIGFQDIALTDESVYGLVWGMESEDCEKSCPDILQFDYDGTPVVRYVLNDVVLSFSVDGDNRFYGISYDNGGEWRLKKYVVRKE